MHSSLIKPLLAVALCLVLTTKPSSPTILVSEAFHADLRAIYDKIDRILYDANPEVNMMTAISWLQGRQQETGFAALFAFQRKSFAYALELLTSLKRIVDWQNCDKEWTELVIDANRRAIRHNGVRRIDRMVDYYAEQHYMQCVYLNPKSSANMLEKQNRFMQEKKKQGKTFGYEIYFKEPEVLSVYDHQSVSESIALIRRQINSPKFQSDPPGAKEALRWLYSKLATLRGDDHRDALDLTYKLRMLETGNQAFVKPYNEMYPKKEVKKTYPWMLH